MESSSLSEIKSIPTLVLKDSRFMKWTAIVITIFLFFLPTVEANTRTADSFGTSRILSSKTVSSAAFLKVIGKMTGGAFEKTVEEAAGTENHEETSNQKTANIVFSDVDGTLVHYPDDVRQENEPGNKTIYLPASSTGMRGVISSKTLQLCQKMRREENVKLVLVSGMRTSTLIKRLPYLPKADAYASEAGGRIFYSVPDPGGNMVTPIPFDGATDDDLMSFGLVEDELWRSKLSEEDAAGMDGYIGDSMDTFLGKQRETAIVPICERKGALWDFCKSLQKKGFVIDYKGYSNCFRVNKKQQNIISEDEFNSLRSLDVSEYGLATSVNLGCIDFYPIYSGKKNCCAYLARHFGGADEVFDLGNNDEILEPCICVCDDDNDLEMAAACGKVFLPSVSSKSMEKAANLSPEKFIVTETKAEGITEMKSTEKSLVEVIMELQSRKSSSGLSYK